MQAVNATTLSIWHSKPAMSADGEANTNTGMLTFEGFAGPLVICTIGAAPSTVHVRIAGVGSTAPVIGFFARTTSTWLPVMRLL